MAKKTILVTGAGGFIGWNLCHFFARQGRPVIGLDLHYPGGLAANPEGTLRLETGDFRDGACISPLLEDAAWVVHLASAHLQVSLDAAEYWDINVHSLEPLLTRAQQSGVHRFVHVSSVGTYGKLAQVPANEDTPCHPQSIYGETKLAGERKVLDFGRKTGFPVVALRPAWVFGPHCPRTHKLYRTLRKKRFVMIGDGSNLRHPMYIDDFCRCVELALDSPRAVGELLLVAGPQSLTTRDLVTQFAQVMGLPLPYLRVPYALGWILGFVAETAFKAIGREPPVSRRSLEFFDTDNAFDISKARTVLGFEPEHDFESGLSRCRPWFERHAG